MEFMIVLVALLLVILIFTRTPVFKGMEGEYKVTKILGKTKPGELYVINDLRLRVGEGKTAQIDHVLINKSGIYVVETKNLSGMIYGDEEQREWTQVLSYGKVKHKFYNPTKQNKSHIYHISQILSEKLPIFSVVVFVKADISNVKASGVYDYESAVDAFKGEEKFTADQIEKAYYELIKAIDFTVSTQEHKKNIHDMLDKIENNICPRCGAKLVLRKGKYGDFYGCSNYPDCKFIKKQ